MTPGRRTIAALLLATLSGCAAADHDHSATTRPAVATDVPVERADPQFWYAQAPALSIVDADFERLWHTAERVSEDYLFVIDRRDRRLGLLTTVPNVSPQWFEPWRRELQTTEDLVDSSVATYRRTIVWQFRREDSGFAATPKVLIERQVLNEERISTVLSRAYFRRIPTERIYGTRETDQNIKLLETYWYPVGRDFALEQRLTDKVQKHLAS